MSVVCAEEETGKSSAGPCASASARAWTGFRCAATGCESARAGAFFGGRHLRCRAASSTTSQQQIHQRSHEQRQHGVVDVVETFAHRFPFAAHRFSGEAEAEDPWGAPDEGEEREADEWHLRHYRREGDERADDREHAAEKDGR